MEEWKDLAKMVPGILMHIVFDIQELLGTITTAHKKFFNLVVEVLSRQTEAPFSDIGDNLATQLGSPAEDLDRAIRELARLGALHAGAGHTFHLYAKRVGLQESEHHADALRHAAAALLRLRTAASQARAYEDATRSAWSFPVWSPSWAGWMSEALHIVLFARTSASMALGALRRMCKAIAREFHDTLRVVNH